MHDKKLLLKLRECVLQEVKGLKIPVKLSKNNLSLKTIPIKYEEEIYAALKYYPELENVHIKFKASGWGFFIMNAMINIFSLFMRKRSYTVYLNYKRLERLKPLSGFEGLNSVLCHELGHVVDYENKSFWSMIVFGMRYLFPSTRKKIELENDIRNYYHGQGIAMKKHNNSLKRAKFLTKTYLNYHKKFYLLNEDIDFLKTLKP